MLNAVEAVMAVEEALLESQQFFDYFTVGDERVCQRCERLDQSSMTRTEINGTFPYVVKYSPALWFPMVHPNCRCVLVFAEEDEPVKKKGSLSDAELADKVKQEVIARHPEVAVDGPREEQFRQVQDAILRLQKIKTVDDAQDKLQQHTEGLSPEDIEDDDDLWDLVALGVLDSLKKRDRK